MDLVAIFLTGLFAGGVSCMSVQGGLLVSTLAKKSEDEYKDRFLNRNELMPVVMFVLFRFVGYTIFGALLGLLGSFFNLSLTVKVAIQLGVVVFMFGVAFNMLKLHPFFRVFSIRPPKKLLKWARSKSIGGDWFAPALVGMLTVLIPCGTTQAMMVYAVSTGSVLLGALVMGVFVIGTSPLFLMLGVIMRRASRKYESILGKVTAVVIILVALYNLSGALALAGIDTRLIRNDTTRYGTGQKVNRAEIVFTKSGYESNPGKIVVKGGEKLELDLINKDGYGCVQAFTIPKLGIQELVTMGSSKKLVLEVPRINGEIQFMCSMGMYKGSIVVL